MNTTNTMKTIIAILLCLAASPAIAISPIYGGGGGGGDALTTNPLSQFAATTSLQLAGVISNETGSGLLVFGTGPVIDNPSVTTGLLLNSAPLTLSGNISSAAWTTSGLRIKGVAATLTDTSSSGTVAAAYTDALGGNTIAASSATTYTNYVSAYVKDPVAGTNVTMTNKSALGADSVMFGTSNQFKVGNTGHVTIEGVTSTGATGTGKNVFSAAPVFDAGSASAGTWMKFTSGTLLTAAEAGALEWDGAAQYFTNNTTEGRMATNNYALFRLAADGSAIGATIADYFGTGSAYPTVTNGVYRLWCELWFTKTTAGTVTFTITNSQTYANISGFAFHTNAAGIQADAAMQGDGLDNTTTAAAAFPPSGSLSTAVEQHFIITATITVGTAGTIKLQATESAGTITPRNGSVMIMQRIPAGNVGAWQ